MNHLIWMIIVLTAWNLTTFILMGMDKRRARGKRRRISEEALFSCAFLFGCVGILSGMYAFRHKTRHLSFRLLVPAAFLADTAIVWFLLRFFNSIL
jgi:uncharacterized membrane protein YsdA (DUF1294 family)